MSAGPPGLPSTAPGSGGPSANGSTGTPPGPEIAAGASSRESTRWAPSPSFTRREVLLVLLAGVLLAILTTWPLILHLGSRISPDLGDPIRTAWEISWVGHAMLHNPLHLFDSNAFYPHPLSLAFSDSLLGYGPAAFFGSGTVAALVRYNLLFLLAWTLAFVGAYLLAREVGLGRLGGAAAGVAFAYAPYRVTEAGHLHVISSGGIALALFLLLRGYRRSSRGLVIAGWLVAIWQLSLGFTLGLQFCYLLAILGLVAVLHWWFRGPPPVDGTAAGQAGTTPAPDAPDGRRPGGLGEAIRSRGPFLPRRLFLITIAGGALLLAVGVYQARPYLKISQEYPTAKRTLREVKNYSSGPAALLSASSENRVWGGVTSSVRQHVHSQNEDVFFPGGLILVLTILGVAGIGGSPLTKRLRIGLVIGIVTVSILAMGLGLTGAGYPYRLLFDYAPGWNGVRVPGRIFITGTLFYALLAGAGAEWLAGRSRRWGEEHSFSELGGIVGVVLLIGLLGEGAGHLAHPVAPKPTSAEIGLPGPRLDLPTNGVNDRVWQYFSTNGFYKIPVGNSTFDIPAVDDLRGGMNAFPDKASIEKLRYYGIRTVVLHLKPYPGLPAEHGLSLPEPPNPVAAAAKPIAGLGVTRRLAGNSVIYEIGPGPAALHGGN